MRVAGSSAESNVGRKRRHNEDNFVAAPPVFAVADGMGGAQAGEVASELAADTVRETEFDPSVTGKERVVALIKAANLRVHERAAVDASASGMGTTMTVAMLQADGMLAIGHVGDSRAYRLRDGELEQLTDDHSLVGELVRRGELTLQEAAVHPQRSVITRALGTEPDVDVDVFTVEARDGDIFLLCSDGLTTMVDPDTIAAILRRNGTHLEAATSALIKAANDRGGDDNITAILFAVADGEGELTAAAAGRGSRARPGSRGHAPPGGQREAPGHGAGRGDDGRHGRRAQEGARSQRVRTVGRGSRSRGRCGRGSGRFRPEASSAPEAESVAPEAETSEAAPAEAHGDTETETERDAETDPGLTTAWPAIAASSTPGASEGEQVEPADEEDAVPEEKASPLRVAIALLVIVLLIVAIVLLVLDALPR